MRASLVALLLLSGISPAVAQAPAAADPEVPGKPILAVDKGGHTARIADFTFAQDGRKLYTLSEDNTTQVWDAVTREHLKTIRLPWKPGPGGKLVGFKPADSVLAVAPDGKLLAMTFATKPYNEATSGGAGMGGRFNNEVFVVHLETGWMRRLPGAQGTIHRLAFSPDGDVLVATGTKAKWMGQGGRFSEWAGDKIWLWRGLQKLGQPEPPALPLWKEWKIGHDHRRDQIRNLQWSPDGGHLAVAFTKFADVTKNAPRVAGPILLWDLKNPDAPPREFARGLFNWVAWSPQGSRLATVEATGKVRTVKTWTLDGLLLRSAKVNENLLAPPGFRGENEVQWVTVAAGGGKKDRASAVVRFDLKKNRADEVARFTLPMDVSGGKVSPDHQRLATYGNAARNEVAMLDFDPNARLQPLNAAAQTTPRFAFEKNGYHFAWTGNAPTKFIAGIDLSSGQEMTASLQPDQLKAEDFRPPSHRALLGEEGKYTYRAEPRSKTGGLINVWTSSNNLILTIYVAGQDWVVCNPEGYYAATPGGEKLVGWHVNNGYDKLASFYPFERFRKKLYRPDVIALVLEKGNVATALKVANALRGPEVAARVEGMLPPRCALELLEHDKGKVKVRVQAEARGKGQPILGLRLFVDGRPFVPGGNRGIKRVDANETSADFPEGKDKVDLTWTFTLPGEKAVAAYQLAVLAKSRDAAGSSNTVAVRYVNPAKLATLHVLAAGINAYNDPALTLSFAAKDARELAEAFAKHSKGELFADVHTDVLLDKDAHRQALLEHILQVRKKVKENDLFVVYFAGHGVKEKDQFYLLTVEARTNALAESALSGTDLRKALGEFPCQVLLMLDACHSAGFGEKGKLRQQSLAPATDEATRALTEDDVGVAVMCAAMGHEAALEKNGNGLFTRAVLEALRHVDGVPFNRSNHLLYTHHLQAFVFDRVSEQSGDRQHPFLSLPWVVQSFPVAKFAGK
jgi:hypothetical protein